MWAQAAAEGAAAEDAVKFREYFYRTLNAKRYIT